MSSFDLTGKKIRNTYQRLTQISGSQLVDGTGSLIDDISLTGSFTGSFVGSLADGIEVGGGSSIIKSSGFLGQTSASQGSPSGFVIYSGSSATTLGSDTLQGTGFKFVGPNNSSSISFSDQNGGDLEIRTDKFTLQNSGDITASNALFSGTAIARNFVQKSVVITGPDAVDENEPNFNDYLVRQEETSNYTLYLDGSQRSGEIINSVEFRLSEQINLLDIVPPTGEGMNSKILITIRNRPDSNALLGFSIKLPNGTLFAQEVLRNNIYTFEISFDKIGTKTITALTATDLSIPVTASNGFNINGDVYATNFYGTASYASYAVSASHEIIKEVSSSFADTASYVTPLNQDVTITGSLDVSASIKMTNDGHAYTYPLEITSDSIKLPSNNASSRSILRQAGAGTGAFLSLRNGSGNERVMIRSYDSGGVQAFFTAGNVGIGTASPSSKLQVKGSGTTDSTTSLLVENSNGDVGIQVLDNGNVGIGGEAQTSAAYKLRVHGGLWADSLLQLQTLAGTAGVGSIRYYNGGATLNMDVYGPHPSEAVKGILQLRSQDLSYTTLANSILHSDPDFLDNPSFVIRSRNTDDESYAMMNYKSGSGFMLKTSEPAGTGTADITFKPSGSEVLFLSSSGNVGIGTTSPDSLLEISATDSTTDFLKLTSGGGTTTPVKLIFEKSAIEQGIIEYNRNGDLEIYNSDSDGGVMINGVSSEAGDLYVSNAGNVGIGTTSPDASAILDIASTSKGVVFPRMTSAQRTAISSPTTGLIVYQTDSTEGLYIYKSTGWVQII